MVRFKNRHLLVEFLTPGQLTPTLSIPGESQDSSMILQVPNAYDEDHDEDDEEDVLPPPALPFLVPSPGVTGRLEISDEAGGAVYRAVRKVVQDVFGDEGWGRVASSFKVLYHSPLTTLTLIRIARPHVRTLWAALTLLRSVEGTPVLPRVIAVSGTIKKLQNRAIAYHRLVTATMLEAATRDMPLVRGLIADGLAASQKEEEEKRRRADWSKEEEAIAQLAD
ncbi:hypothetical protein EHS25_008044 [Saitozyma podzolica]|uniref:Ribonuclease P/MRP protein subunit POP5 n=1 Tax=Saitozyma podzolica TaxID=1890683 RepID=A0A427YNF9_9TREE|nr:hypothetical protein EHS25_008044 [Saitozyma podzolica]